MKKCMTLWMVLCFTLITWQTSAQAKSDSLKVLFIGNSFTYFNELPQTVSRIAASQGVKLAVTQFAPGGYYLRQHVKNPKLLEAIRKGGWDYVVIQEQSAAPAMPTDTVIQNTYPAAHTLDSLILAHSPSAKVIFYMTWGHKDGCQEKVDNYPLIYSYKGMQDRLRISYLEMAYRNNAWCAPVGIAWQHVREEHPNYLLYMPDRSHPSTLGSYLAANVIFCTIHQKPYQTDVFLGLPAEQCEYIQQVAQKSVLNNLTLLNIKK